MTAPTAPPSHSQRALLHEEIHARPPQPVTAPQAISHVVMWADAPERDASRAHLAALLQQRGLAAPPAGATHWRADLGSLRVVCEMHTEFVSWTFATALAPEGLGQEPPAAALGAVPGEWLAGLPGQCLCRLDLWVLDRHSHADGRLVAQVLQEGTL